MMLRKATQDDVDQIAGVLVSFYNMDDIEEAKETFLSETKKDHVYIVAIVDNKIIGLVTWLMHGLPKHGLAELDRICLLPESRGKGVGKQLVEALIKDANQEYEKTGKKLRKLYLLTHADNTSAQSFYKKVGFSHEVTLKSHYYKDKDEFMFSIFF